MKALKALLALLVLTIATFALAQAPDAAVDTATSWINSHLTAVVVGAIGSFLELVFRMLPTQAPLSWAWIFTRTLHSLARLFETVAKFLDGWLPQQTK